MILVLIISLVLPNFKTVQRTRVCHLIAESNENTVVPFPGEMAIGGYLYSQ